MTPRLELREKIIFYLIRNKCECTLSEIGGATPYSCKKERDKIIKSLIKEGLLTVKKIETVSINKGVERTYVRTLLLFDYDKFRKS